MMCKDNGNNRYKDLCGGVSAQNDGSHLKQGQRFRQSSAARGALSHLLCPGAFMGAHSIPPPFTFHSLQQTILLHLSTSSFITFAWRHTRPMSLRWSRDTRPTTT